MSSLLILITDNAQRFLEMLTSKMNSSNLYAIQSSGDADALIVNSTTEAAKLKSTVVVGKDTDLFMLLIHGVQLSDHSVFLTSDEKSKTARKLWDVKYAKEVLGEEICNAILPIHALLGCDTTSRLFSIGKQVALERFRNTISIFNAKQEDIVKAGEELLVMIYGGMDDITLDILRFEKFHQKLASSATAVAPETVNPTSSAASFHSLCVYHQVQCWTGQEDLCNGAGKLKNSRCTPSTPPRKLHHQVFLKLSGVDVKVIVGKTNVHFLFQLSKGYRNCKFFFFTLI